MEVTGAKLFSGLDDTEEEKGAVVTTPMESVEPTVTAPISFSGLEETEEEIQAAEDEFVDVSTTNIIEAEQVEPLDTTQTGLFTYYNQKYPDLYDKQGNLVDFDLAVELGVIKSQAKAAVPLTEEEDISGVRQFTPHISTLHFSTNYDDFVYANPETESLNLQKQYNNSQLSRMEKVAANVEAREDNIASAANKAGLSREDFIEQVQIPNMPDGFMKTFFEYTGSTGFDALMNVSDALQYGTEGFVDASQTVFEQARELDPEWWDSNIAKDPATAAVDFAGDIGVMLEMGEAATAFGGVIPAAFEKSAKQIGKDLQKQAKKRAETRAKMEDNKRLNATKASFATAEERQAAEKAAKEAAEVYKELGQDLIREYEQKVGDSISRIKKDGTLEIDPDLVRKVGREKLQAVDDAANRSKLEILLGKDNIQTELALGGSELLNPILKPEKFNAIVAVAGDLKKTNPDAFKGGTVIDNLVKLTVDKELLSTPDMIDTLNKYGLSFEDFVLMIAGSGSEAGKVLNVLSQIKRVRPLNEARQAIEDEAKENAGSIRRLGMRIENVRRGGLVSQLATAARNVQSAAIRSPMEGLGNVMDTALYNLSNEGVGKAAKSMVSFENWKDSFRHMKYIFSPTLNKEVDGYVDLLLKNDQFAKQYDILFNNINEIQKLTGRGEGGSLDGILSKLEDGVDLLNTPNRWQEYMVRRGVFFGELERLVKRDWGVELVENLNEGKLRSFLNDASDVRPENGRSFVDIVADATNKAMDVTYAKQPDVPIFKSASSFIVRNGLTTVLPFPRFMFNSMELMGQYAAGASIPLTRKVSSIVTGGKIGAGPLTAKDRQRISRNLVGMATIGAAYMYRTSDEAPADYKIMSVTDEAEADISPQFPMRQFLYLGEATKRLQDETFDDWFDAREFLQTFLGTNLRTGVGQSFMEDIAGIISGTDLTDMERAGKTLGGALGNYLSTWMVPFAQAIDAQRAMGVRGLEFKDVREDPELTFGSGFSKEFARPFEQRGYFMSPEREEALPARENIFKTENKRVMPASKFLGISLMSPSNEDGKYLGKLGFTSYDLSSKSGVPSIQRAEDQYLKLYIPTLVEIAKDLEVEKREEYSDLPQNYRDKYTEEEHVNGTVRPFITESMRTVKSEFARTGGEGGKGIYADNPEYTIGMMYYRKLPPEIRKQSVQEFQIQMGREPDPAKAEDLLNLVDIGKELRSIYSGN